MSQVYSITFNGLGDAATAAATYLGPYPLLAAQNRVAVAEQAMNIVDATPTLLMNDEDKAALERIRGEALVTINQRGIDIAPGHAEELRYQANNIYNAAIKRRMYVLGGVAALGLGGYLYFRKR